MMMVAGDGADTASADFCPSPPGPASTTRVGESLAHRDRIITSTQLPACLNGALLTPGVHMPKRICWRPAATSKMPRLCEWPELSPGMWGWVMILSQLLGKSRQQCSRWPSGKP